MKKHLLTYVLVFMIVALVFIGTGIFLFHKPAEDINPTETTKYTETEKSDLTESKNSDSTVKATDDTKAVTDHTEISETPSDTEHSESPESIQESDKESLSESETEEESPEEPTDITGESETDTESTSESTSESSHTEASTEPKEEPNTKVAPRSDIDLSKVIAVTFDDGPDTLRDQSSTSRILDVAEKYGVKFTFFVQGVNLCYAEFKERNREILKREAALGCQIGTHTFDHPNLKAITNEEALENVSKGVSLIEEITGQKVTIMRPPYGNLNEEKMNLIDFPFILWSIDTRDWEHKDPKQTINIILNEVKGGSIILMHDIYSTTADAVEIVVPKLLDAGYTLVTVSEMFELYNLKLESHKKYYKAK